MHSGQDSSRPCNLSRYLILIAIVLFSVTSASAAITDLVMERQYMGYGVSAGYSGMTVIDLDDDGTTETVVTAGASYLAGINNYYYVLHQNAYGIYSMSYLSPHFEASIVQLEALDTDLDSTAEIYVATADGVVHIIDSATYTETATITVASGITDMSLGDVDGDGQVEIVTVSPLGLEIHDAKTLVNELTEPLFNGRSLTIGNIDDDAALEVVITGGDCGKVIDGTIHDMEWSYPTGFGDFVATGDIDGDTREEIVTIYASSFITVFDGELKSPKWEIFEPETTALTLADVTGDGTLEILTGDSDTGAIHSINGVDGSELWLFPGLVLDTTPGVTGLAVGDPDDDGQLEMVIGTGTAGDDLSYVIYVDIATLAVEWHNYLLDGSFAPTEIADVDDDGLLETLMVSRNGNGNFENGKINYFEGLTQELEWLQEIAHVDTTGVLDIAIGDVDGDTDTEYVITTAGAIGGKIQVYNGATGALEYETAEYENNYFTTLAIGDVDNDTQMEIVAGQGGGSITEGETDNVIVFNGADGTEEWVSFVVDIIGTVIYDIEIANVDADANPEIIITSSEGLFAFDGITHLNDGTLCGPGFRAIETVDYDTDTEMEIIVGTAFGELLFIDGATMTVEASTMLSDIPVSSTIWNPASLEEEVILDDGVINALKAIDIDTDGVTELLVANSGVEGSALIVFDPMANLAESRFTTVEQGLGEFNNIGVGDLDDDGDNDVVIGSRYSLFRLNAGILQYISADPATLTLAATVIGDTSPAQTVTLTNNSLTAGISLDIPDTVAFAQTNDCATVAPGATCTVSVTLTPDAAGDLEAVLVASSTSPYVAPLGVSLFGVGMPIPAATVSPDSVVFDATPSGTRSAPVVLTVTNNGSTSELFFLFYGRDDGSFDVDDTCGSVPTGTDCTVSVSFTPFRTGDHDAMLYIFSDDPNTHYVTVSVSGSTSSGAAPSNGSSSDSGGGCFLQSLGIGD